jgi:hypothetical protein
MPSHDERVDELFRLPPEEFTAARDRLAAEMKDAGDADSAKEVKGLKRPTVAAWGVNMAVARKPDLMASLLDASGRLRAAQRRAASGLSADDYRDAMTERRTAVRRLTEEAAAALQEAGRQAESHLGAVGRTFEAAASEAPAGEAVRAGRLSKELEPTAGFEAIDAFAVIPGGAEPAAPPPTKEDRKAAKANRELASAEREVERQTRKAATARHEARAAEGEAEEAEKAVRVVEHDLGRARKRADEARQRADRATRKAEQAERSLEDAEAKVADLRGGATGAR